MALTRDEIKAAGREALRAQLAFVGSERARDRYTDAVLPVALRAAQAGGLRLTGMAAAVGLSRQGTYDALSRGADELVTDHDLEPFIASVVAASAPIDTGAIAQALRLESSRVYKVLHALDERGLVQFAGSSGYDNQDTFIWRITEAGIDWLDETSRASGWAPEHTAVYFIVDDPTELPHLTAAIEKIVGAEHYSLLPVGTTSSPFDELAVAVGRSPDGRETLRKAYDVWDEARIDAGLPPRLPRLADISW